MGDSNRIDILRALALSSMPSLTKRPQKQQQISRPIEVVVTKPVVPVARVRPEDKEEGELSSDDEIGRSAPPVSALESSLPNSLRNAGLTSNAPLQEYSKVDTLSAAATPVQSLPYVGVSSTSGSSSAARVSIVNKSLLLSAVSAQEPCLILSSTPKQVTTSAGDVGVVTQAGSDVVQAAAVPNCFSPSLSAGALPQGSDTRLTDSSHFKKLLRNTSLTRSPFVVNNSPVFQSSVIGALPGVPRPGPILGVPGPIPGTYPSLPAPSPGAFPGISGPIAGSLLGPPRGPIPPPAPLFRTSGRFCPPKDSGREVAAEVNTASIAARPAPLAVSVSPVAGSEFSTSTTFPSPVVPLSISPTKKTIGETGSQGVCNEADAFLASLCIPVGHTVDPEQFLIKFDEDSDSDGDNPCPSITSTDQVNGDTQKAGKLTPGAQNASTDSQTTVFMSNPGSSGLNAEINRMKKQIAAMERTQGKSAGFQVPTKTNKGSGGEAPRQFSQPPSEAKNSVHVATGVRPVADDLESMRLCIAAKENELLQRRQKLAVKRPDGSGKGMSSTKGTGITPTQSAPLNYTTVEILEDTALQSKDQAGKVTTEKGSILKKEINRRVDGLPALALAGPAGANLGGFRNSLRQGSRAGLEGNSKTNSTSSCLAPPSAVSSGQRQRSTAAPLKRSRSEEFDKPRKAQRMEEPTVREEVDDISERSRDTSTTHVENRSSRQGVSTSTPAAGQPKQNMTLTEAPGPVVNVTALPNSDRGKKHKVDRSVESVCDRVADDDYVSVPHGRSSEPAAKSHPPGYFHQESTVLVESSRNEPIAASNPQFQLKGASDEATNTARKELREAGISLSPMYQSATENAREVATGQTSAQETAVPTGESRDANAGNHSASLQVQRTRGAVNTSNGLSSPRADLAVSATLTNSLAKGQPAAQPALDTVTAQTRWQPNIVRTVTPSDSHPVGNSGILSTVPSLPPVTAENRIEQPFQRGHLGNVMTERYSIQRLLEEEELLDRQLEELQEARLRCEQRERLARKEYRDSQAALRAANADCDSLYQRKELLLSQLHALEARGWATKSYSSRLQVPNVEYQRHVDDHFPASVFTSHLQPVGQHLSGFDIGNLNGNLNQPLLNHRFPSPHSQEGMGLATLTGGIRREQFGSNNEGVEDGYRSGIRTKPMEIGDGTHDSLKSMTEHAECGSRGNSDAAAAVVAGCAVMASRLTQVNRPNVLDDGVFLGSNSRAGFCEMSDGTENFLSFQPDNATLKSSSSNPQGPSVASGSGTDLPMEAALVVDSTLLVKSQSEAEPLDRCTERRPRPDSEGEVLITQTVSTDTSEGMQLRQDLIAQPLPLVWTAEQTNGTDPKNGGGSREATLTTSRGAHDFHGNENIDQGARSTILQDSQSFEPAQVASQDISGSQGLQIQFVSVPATAQERRSFLKSGSTLDPMSDKYPSSVRDDLTLVPPQSTTGTDASISVDCNDEPRSCVGPETGGSSTQAYRNGLGTKELQEQTSSPLVVSIQNKATAELKFLKRTKRSSKDVLLGPGIHIKPFGAGASQSKLIMDEFRGITSGQNADHEMDGRFGQDQERPLESLDEVMVPTQLQENHVSSLAGCGYEGDSGGVKAASTSQPLHLDVTCKDPATLKCMTAQIPQRLQETEVASLNKYNQQERIFSNGAADENANTNVDFAPENAENSGALEQEPNTTNRGVQNHMEITALGSGSQKQSARALANFVPGSTDRAFGVVGTVSPSRFPPSGLKLSTFAHSEEGHVEGGSSGGPDWVNLVKEPEIAEANDFERSPRRQRDVEENETAEANDSERSSKRQRDGVRPRSPKQSKSELKVPTSEYQPEHPSVGPDSAGRKATQVDTLSLGAMVNNAVVGDWGASRVVQVGSQGDRFSAAMEAKDVQILQVGRSRLEDRQSLGGHEEESRGSFVEPFEDLSVNRNDRESSHFPEPVDAVNSGQGDGNGTPEKICSQSKSDSPEHAGDTIVKGDLNSSSHNLHVEESSQERKSSPLAVEPKVVKPNTPPTYGDNICKSLDMQVADVNEEEPASIASFHAREQVIEQWVPSADSLAILNCIPRVHSQSSKTLYPSRDSNFWSHTISPFKLLCKFEHRGECNNSDCPWQHADDYTLSSEQLGLQIQSYTAGDAVNPDEVVLPSDRSTLPFAATSLPPSQQSITSVARTVVSLSKTKQKPGGPLLTSSLESIPIYQNGMYKLKSHDFTEKHFLSHGLQLDRDHDNYNSFLLSLSIPRPFPPDMPCLLDSPENLPLLSEKIQVHHVESPDRRHKQGLQGQLLQTQVDGKGQDSIDEETWLEMALREIDYDFSTPNDREHDQALYYLSRALESRPNSIPLWVVYASLFHLRRQIVEGDDMFQHAVSFNKGSYGLWILYINSRPDLEMRLEAYETAVVALCNHARHVPTAERDEYSAYALDVGLQMLYCWCVAGRLKSAFTWMESLISGSSRDDLQSSAIGSPAALLSTLTQHDACILWIACTYLVACSQIPPNFVSRLGFKHELPGDLSWKTHAKFDNVTSKEVIRILKTAASQGHGCLALEYTVGDGDRVAKEVLGINYLQCLALYEGLESASRFGEKMMALYPMSVDLICTCARITERQNGQSMALRVLEEALQRWPNNDLSGTQYFWNQYAGHALLWGGADAARHAFQECISAARSSPREGSGFFSAIATFPVSNVGGGTSGGDSVSPLEEGWGPLAQYFVAVTTLNILNQQSVPPEDRVFTFLNLALVRLLGRDVLASQAAVKEALKAATSEKLLNHCWRELTASYMLHGQQSTTRTDQFTFDNNLLNLLDKFAKESRVVTQLTPLFRKSFEGIKKLRMRKFFEDLVGAAPSDHSLLNTLLGMIYGLKLLPEDFSFPQICHLGEGILEVVPGNVPLAMSLCRIVLQLRDAPTQMRASAGVWACALLIRALFQSYPVAPEAYWVEAGLILRHVSQSKSTEEFYRKALRVYPYSVALQQGLKAALDELDGPEFTTDVSEGRHRVSEPIDKAVKD